MEYLSCDESKILFNSDKFINLKAPLFELLLKRNDLNVDEIEIWESLLKWCFAQQNMKNDPAKWSKEDITKIERSLHRLIPLIRFYDIEPTDFFYKVYNYRDILPQDLVHDLLEFHIVPNMRPKTNIPPSRKSNLKFTDIKNIVTAKLVYVNEAYTDYAILCRNDRRPYMGNLHAGNSNH